MTRNKKIGIGMYLLFVILFLSFISAYTRSDVQWSVQPTQTTNLEKAVCQEGQDFAIQIAPLGCTPAVIRSDLLEENDVPVYCQLSATKINPLIDVEAIDAISFSGKYPKEVSGIGFHPAKAAVGIKGQLNSPVLNNIGYVVINLEKQANVSAIPDSISGTLSAKVRYNVKNAFGVGNALFHLPEINDEEWESRRYQYTFWSGKGTLRAENIENDEAQISVYSNDRQISSVTLKKGETSGNIYLPEFECQAGLKLQLVGLENPDTRAKLRINAEIVEVAEGEKFLDNKCTVKQIRKKGLEQKVGISCAEDDKANNFNLIINPKALLTINGVEQEVELGQWLYDSDTLLDGRQSIYVAYMGTKANSKDSKDLYIYFINSPEKKDKLSEDELSRMNLFVGDLIAHGESIQDRNLDKVINSLKFSAGAAALFGQFLKEGKGIAWANFGEEITIFDKTISILGFSEAQNIELIGTAKENYDNAVTDYETIRNQFASERYIGDVNSTFGEQALYQEIILSWNSNQKATVIELCKEFMQNYPHSNTNIAEYCKNDYHLSNSDSQNIYVTINKQTRQISFDGIYEPSFADYSSEILIRGSNGKVSTLTLTKNGIINLNEFKSDESKNTNDYIQFVSLDDTFATVVISANGKTERIKLEKGIQQTIEDYIFSLQEINIKKVAKVSVISNINNAGTQTNFSFKIGIEKRAIVLPPEKVKQTISNLNKEIKEWEKMSSSLGKVVEGLKTGCVIAGAALVAKNFISNLGGTGIARQSVMQGSGGWNERCSDLVAKGTYSSMDQCFTENSEEIDSDVSELSGLIEQQNTQIKQLEEGITTQEFLSDNVVDTDAFVKSYSPQVTNTMKNLPEQIADPNGLGAPISKNEMVTILSYDAWKQGKYSVEQLRDIELYTKVLNNPNSNEGLKNIANSRLYSRFSDIKANSENYAQISNWADDLRLSTDKFSFIEIGGENVKKIPYTGTTLGEIGMSVGGFPTNTPAALVTTSNGKKYIIVLDNSAGISKLPIKRLDSDKLAIYDSSGIFVSEPPIEFRNIYFERIDASSYKNQYKNAKLSYYETEPYKGLPAIVPFDTNNGWYAATKQTLPVGGSIQPYEASGRVNSFYLCNIGANGLEEFQTIGDDTCQMINLGTGQPYNQFPGLSETEAKKIINQAVDAIEQASKLYKSGLSGKVKIGNNVVDVGSPAVDVPQFQCQDFMSPKECLLMFNLCDPVICPSSRCDLGGAYPVKDVIQSGIVGSIVLCLPNIQEKIFMPVCLTGIKAGIDGFLSVKTSYRDCLNESLNTGRLVGICDEVYSIYLCDFFWRQALPIAEMVIPKIIESLLGQNVRGGGEYLSVSNAWGTAEKSIEYMTKFYGANSNKAFLARSTEEIGSDICKSYTSAVYPSGGDLLGTLTQADSPPQFHGRFDEIPMTSATVPPTSHYKVFYHIFAGKDTGAYYQVYLKGSATSSYYQDTTQNLMIATGYANVGGYASETKDLIAASGYDEMCINVNGQEECGFAQVSTDFALNYIQDKYIQSQATQTGITKESECISGTASAYSLLSGNLQSAAEEAINPEIYNKGLTRVCSTDNPGKGTDAAAGTESAKWKEVGYCDNEKIKCWIDTESVKEIIKTTTVEGETLETVSENYVDILSKLEGGYLDEEQFSVSIKKIEDEKNPANRVNMIQNILEKVFWNKQKAYLYYLRGNAYAELLIAILPKNKIVAITKEETAKTTTSQKRCGPNDEYFCNNDCPMGYDASTPTDGIKCGGLLIKCCRVSTASSSTEAISGEGGERIWQTAKNLANKNWEETRNTNTCRESLKSQGTLNQANLNDCVSNNVCARFVLRAMINAGVRTPELVNGKYGNLVNAEGEFTGAWTALESIIEMIKVFEANKNEFIEITNFNSFEKGDIIILGFGAKKTQHLGIFDSYNNNRKSINVYGEPGLSGGAAELQKGNPIKSSEWYVYKAFRFVGNMYSTSINNPVEIIEEEIVETANTVGEKIALYASDVASGNAFGSSDNSVKFVSASLINSGVSGISETSSMTTLVSVLNSNTNFIKIDISSINNLRKGDIIFLGKGCDRDYSIGIFNAVSGNKIVFYTNLNNGVKSEIYSYLHEVDNNLYVYRIYRYVGDLGGNLMENADARTEWTLNSAYEKSRSLSGSYKNNKIFVDELIFDKVLTEEECKTMRGGFLFFGNKDMDDLATILINKIESSGISENNQETNEPTTNTLSSELNKVINAQQNLASVSYQGQPYCARYSRELAFKYFGYNYYYTDVWCRKAVGDKVVWETPSMTEVYKMQDLTDIREENENQLISLENAGTLKPGMIVGVYYPATSSGVVYGKDVPCEGFGVSASPYYTHNLLYLGKNNNGELVFAELFHLAPSIRTLDDFGNDGFVVMAVFSPPASLN